MNTELVFAETVWNGIHGSPSILFGLGNQLMIVHCMIKTEEWWILEKRIETTVHRDTDLTVI